MAFPLFARTVLLGEPCPPERRIPIAEIDHSVFDGLLIRFVDERGRVAYADWKADQAAMAALHLYLVTLGRGAIDSPAPTNAALAFWINAYNALTLAGILRLYPLRTVREHTAVVVGFNLWKHLRLHVGGKTWSLSEIEHDVLRTLGDPRVHFAIVCGANGCPVLSRTAYTPSTLFDQLSASEQAFMERPDGMTFDPARRVVRLSRLFKWYAADFGERLTEMTRSYGEGVTAEYLPYDWGLNDQKTG